MWKGGIMLGDMKIKPLKLRLTESCDEGISEGLTTRFVVRMFFETDAELYKEVAFTARVIAATGDTIVLLPLVRPEEYRFCVFEGSGEDPPA